MENKHFPVRKVLWRYQLLSVLPASLDCFLGLVFNPSCSLAPAEQTTLDTVELSPDNIKPSPTSHDLVLDYLLVLPEVPDCSPFTLVTSMEK